MSFDISFLPAEFQTLPRVILCYFLFTVDLGLLLKFIRKKQNVKPAGKILFSTEFFSENCDSQKFPNSDPSLRFTVAEFPIIWQSELKRETISPDWFPSKYEISFDIIFWNVLSRSDRITILPDVFVRYCLFMGSSDGFNNASTKNHSISHQSWRKTPDYELFRSTIAVNCVFGQMVDPMALPSNKYLTK